MYPDSPSATVYTCTQTCSHSLSHPRGSVDVPSGFLQALRGAAGVRGAGRQSPAALRTEARQDSALCLPDKKQPPSLQTSARQLSNHRVPFLISEVASGRGVPWPSVSPPCRSGDAERCDPRQRGEGCGETPACCGCRRLPAAPALPRSAVSSPKNPV